MRFFSLLTNVVTHLQLIAAFNVLAVKWPDGLRELVRGLSFINLDLQWVEDQFPDVPPFPVRLRNLIAFALLPFLVLWIASGMLMFLAMPQLVLFFVATVQVPFAAINADHPAEIVFVAIILILALLSNPIFLCKFNDPDERPGALVPRLLRRAQDAFPPSCFVGGIFIAYFGRDANASIIAGSLLSVIGCVCTVSVVLQNATPVGRIDRYSRICRLSTFLGRQTMGMVFFAFNAAVIPILTLGLESVTFVEYKCPEGSMFNPYVQRDEENQYSTSPALFCDPCNFTNPARCRTTTIGATASGNLSASLCPASTYERLALDPQTPRSSNWLYGGLLFAFLAYGLLMLCLFLCSMRRGISKAADAFKPGEPLHNVNIKEALAQRTDEGDEGGDDETAEAEQRVLSETQHEPGQLFGADGGEAAKDRWEFVCESVEAKVFEFCSDYRYPMRYTYALLMLHKALIVVVSVPLAPTSTSGAAAGMATVHGLVLLFLIAARPFRSKLLTRLTLAEVACEFLVGIFAAVASDDSSDVPPGLGVAVLIVNIVVPIVAVASTASELKGKWDERKEKSRRREAYDKAHEESLLGDEGHASAERGAEMSPMMPPPQPPCGMPPPQQQPPPMPMNNAGGGSITMDGGQPHQQPYYPPPQGYAQQPGGPPPVYPAGPPPPPMQQQQQAFGAPPPPPPQYQQYQQQQQQGFGVAGYGQQQQQPAMLMMPPSQSPPVVGSSVSAAARREKVRQAALALPEAKVADSIDGSSKWIVTVPALVLFIPLIVASWYVLITSAREQSIGIPTLDSPTEFLASAPGITDPLQDILKRRDAYGNFSAFAHDACCFPGAVTSLPQFPVGKLPNQERWIWRDSIFSNPPRLRVVNHARIDLRIHDPRASNGAYGVNGFGIRPMCGGGLTPFCSMTNVGSGQFPPRASCSANTFSQYALDYLW